MKLKLAFEKFMVEKGYGEISEESLWLILDDKNRILPEPQMLIGYQLSFLGERKLDMNISYYYHFKTGDKIWQIGINLTPDPIGKSEEYEQTYFEGKTLPETLDKIMDMEVEA